MGLGMILVILLLLMVQTISIFPVGQIVSMEVIAMVSLLNIPAMAHYNGAKIWEMLLSLKAHGLSKVWPGSER